MNYNVLLPNKNKIDSNYFGIIYILVHSSLDVVFFVICKQDALDNNIENFIEEIIFVLIYNFKALIVLFVYFLVKSGVDNNFKKQAKQFIKFGKSKLYFYTIMSFFSVLGFATFLYGLNDIMLANAMSLKYIEQILWVLVGVIVLKEKLNLKQVFGILVSFLGIIIVIISNIETDNHIITYAFPVIAAICWTISSNVGKHIVQDQNNILVHMLYYYMFHVLVVLFFALSLYLLVEIEIQNINMGSYEFLVHIFSMTFFYKALKIAPISLLAPFIYIKLIVSAIIGYFVFLDHYEPILLFAYSLIMFGGIKILKNL